MTNKSKLESSGSMSNTGYHANGKPLWWARIGTGKDARFLDIPRTRGDEKLSCLVDVPPGTRVQIGAGKGDHKTVRETVTTTAGAPTVADDGAEAVIAWNEAKIAETAEEPDDKIINVKSAIGALMPGARTRGEIRAARRAVIDGLRAAEPAPASLAAMEPGELRAALETERAELLDRLAEIDAQLAALSS